MIRAKNTSMGENLAKPTGICKMFHVERLIFLGSSRETEPKCQPVFHVEPWSHVGVPIADDAVSLSPSVFHVKHPPINGAVGVLAPLAVVVSRVQVHATEDDSPDGTRFRNATPSETALRSTWNRRRHPVQDVSRGTLATARLARPHPFRHSYSGTRTPRRTGQMDSRRIRERGRESLTAQISRNGTDSRRCPSLIRFFSYQRAKIAGATEGVESVLAIPKTGDSLFRPDPALRSTGALASH
jgi:hypothetical protein